MKHLALQEQIHQKTEKMKYTMLLIQRISNKKINQLR